MDNEKIIAGMASYLKTVRFVANDKSRTASLLAAELGLVEAIKNGALTRDIAGWVRVADGCTELKPREQYADQILLDGYRTLNISAFDIPDKEPINEA